ncbi:MAG: trifunctional transcriptional regulator/proline dehydrogenase/L-glutamate gamma-semialdehyde dehydrogenase [Erythrobacter sp.]|nr:MAG: trifunctional transcriptional regulator/proline dehydrogenase/L-glutamate gamma-semialdehyde dehydrogenase [Erythrobacter sp.]
MSTPVPFAAFAPPIRPQSPLRQAITAAYRRSEQEAVAPLIPAARLTETMQAEVRATARQLITGLRANADSGGVNALVQEYSLSSQEGVALMCLAEALLRIPDVATRDALIRDKIGPGDWAAHLGQGRSLFLNAATWGLVVTGKLVENVDDTGLSAALTRLVARVGEPVIRRGVDMAMRMMGEQFVAAETIAEALRRAGRAEAKGFTYSYDMLGEAAVTAADAARYYDDYEQAIHAIGAASAGRGIYAGPGISIKLSALHPRYARSQANRAMGELLPRVKSLALLAKGYDIGLNIDAEEADRLELSLDLIESLALDSDLAGWNGLGVVLQAYGKRCPFVIDWIIDLAQRADRRIMVRLAKGAYWDAEIKRAQVDGLADFPVYTRKVHTDISYVACARKLLAAREHVFPQFATHNAQTLATIYHLAGPEFALGDWEFQCLHGMGEPLYEQVVGPDRLNRPCRIYAPVGSHETLLAYLVRRLLENGANSSFVNRISDPAVSVDDLVGDPLAQAGDELGKMHADIALPANIYGERRNSAGLDLSNETTLASLSQALEASATMDWTASFAAAQGHDWQAVTNPADHREVVGKVAFASTVEVHQAAVIAAEAAEEWAATTPAMRAVMLEKAADALEARMPHLLGLIMREAGKSLPNAIAEVREAVDFLRYYAAEAQKLFDERTAPLGPIVCISPWNFPLAIFTGQIAAALAAGNTVLAKPAEETPLIAAEAVRILHEAGVPADVLQFVPGDGAIGAALVAAPQVAGVMFTGSTEVAKAIQRQLSTRLGAHGGPIPLIAETGGQNAMIVDSSALTEQVVADVIASAFDSAGQRCSALRVLCLQEDIADRTLTMLKGAMAELRVGNTDRLAVDIGPVITADAQQGIAAHIEAMRAKGFAVHQLALAPETAHGTFIPPTIIEIASIADLSREVFGPVLHVVRFAREGLEHLIDEINATGYGLTFGLHTRLEETIAHVSSRIAVGNIYINRNTIGAVVGVQPFGGRGLSGTGPKAGGPLYLRRLVTDPAPRPAMAGHQADAALTVFAQWLDSQGEHDLSRLARQLQAASPLGQICEFAGPVGERNQYALHPRGTILLAPFSQAGLFHQISAALAAGNHFALTDAAHSAFAAQIAEMPAEVLQRMVPETAAIASALLEGEGEGLLATLSGLASASGKVIPAQAAPTGAMLDPLAYQPELLVEEVSISTNTTAAGGNASLMALA